MWVSRMFRMLTMAGLLVTATPVLAQTVRGRIDRRAPWGVSPVIGVVVVLDQGVARAISGPDGMYYFFNVPPGPHMLQILNPMGQIGFTYSIAVFAEPSDVAPILVPW